MSSGSLHNYYRASQEKVRAAFDGDMSEGLKFYDPLVTFVSDVQTPENSRLLDVGCGVGWSTHAFALKGYDAVGFDLKVSAFEPPPHDRCQLLGASATEIPLADESFDAVVCYQCIEHVDNPELGLDEMVRVCRPGGIVVVVGPNLMSPVTGLLSLMHPSNLKNARFRRRPGLPRHPYGNTVPEILAGAVRNSFQLVPKLMRSSPRFLMRAPDVVPPFHADNDACYLCNPVDLVKYFRQKGFKIELKTKPGRPPLSYLFAGGTWVAARKPKS